MTAFPIALESVEHERLAKLEAVIARGLDTFMEVGTALGEIRDARFYRFTHPTFEAYLADRWSMSRARAYQLMDAATVHRIVSTTVDTVDGITERAARELAPMLRDQAGSIPDVWQESARRSGGEAPTAAVVREVVRERTRSIAPLMLSESDEWWTPREVIARVLQAFPSIDLDPCSNPGPARNVPAMRHHDITDSGLEYTWQGRVFVNPPYGDALEHWAAKVAMEAPNLTEAIVLVPARTETRWWHVIPANVVCFFKGRLHFRNGVTGQTGPATFPSAALYVGDSPERFARAFADAGLIYERVQP